MVAEVARIYRLPPTIAAQVKSSASIPCLDATVLGLFKNSLDAGARKIDVRVDYARGCCIVEDDGDGIAPCEFLPDGGLGQSHCLSCLIFTHGPGLNF